MAVNRRTLSAMIVSAGTALSAHAIPPGVRVVNDDAAPGGNGLSWATAYADLQDALDAAASSGGSIDEIWVAAGTYRPSRRTEPNEPRSVTFRLVEQCGIYGGFVGVETSREQRNAALNVCVLSGMLTPSGNAFHVVRGAGALAGAVLNGFTISGGMAYDPLVPMGNPMARGGGVWIESGGPVLRNLILTENAAELGGGICLDSPAVVSNCVFRANNVLSVNATAGGAGIYLSSGGLVEDCLIESNISTAFDGCGGGVGGTGQVVRCVIRNNRAKSGGGGVAAERGPLTLTNCILDGNMAQSGAAGVALGNVLTLSGCLVVRNVGSGIFPVLYCPAGLTALDCTIADNPNGSLSASILGAGQVANTIIWNNCVPDPCTQSSNVSGGTFNHCTVQGWTGSLGGIASNGLDPLLDASWRLGANSPCIDSGNNALTPPGLFTDLTGTWRFADAPSVPNTGSGTSPLVDRGAYEFGSTAFCYANCDASTVAPILNVTDFACFMGRFADGHPLANCDASTFTPVLNVADFICFLNRYAAGCP